VLAAIAAAGARRAAPAIDDALWEGALVPMVERVIRAGWFSFDVEGAEHVPADGRAVYAQNHAGWFPLDAFFVGLGIRRAIGPCRTPYFAAAEAALALPFVGTFIRRVGAVPASWFRRPERLPARIRACAFFPEGVPGNTKPFWEAYRMRPWNRGFVRVAAALGLPIVPVAVLGGEECLPVAWTVRLLEPLVGSRFGMPLALLPLPARWRIVFHPPVRLVEGPRLLTDGQRAAEVAGAIRATVQGTIDRRAGRYPLAQLSSLVARRRAALPRTAPVPETAGARSS
jgi:1-acyl-sn-glycerol-3-phosphate acyltransferase